MDAWRNGYGSLARCESYHHNCGCLGLDLGVCLGSGYGLDVTRTPNLTVLYRDTVERRNDVGATAAEPHVDCRAEPTARS